MDMSWIECILYGLVSGLTEFLPVSSYGHQAILLHLFGISERLYLMEFFIHIGMLLALIYAFGDYVRRIRRQKQLHNHAKRYRKGVDFQLAGDMMLLKMAAIPMLVGFIFFSSAAKWGSKLYIVAILLLLNGILLHIPMYLPLGNKDSRNMSRLDGLLLGITSVTGILPGISRVGIVSSTAVARGASPVHAFRWASMLSVLALAVLSAIDLFSMFQIGFAGLGFISFLQSIMAGIFSCVGAFFGIWVMKNILAKSGFSAFSYYCLGAAMFAFILYLI